MAADDLAMQGARPSAAMQLTWFFQNIPALASNGLSLSYLSTVIIISSTFPAPAPATTPSTSVMNNGRQDTTLADLQKLQQQLQDIKDQVSRSIMIQDSSRSFYKNIARYTVHTIVSWPNPT